MDALSEAWANKPDNFKDCAFADGSYTLSYGRGSTLYGLADETSRIDINTAATTVLRDLIYACGAEEGQAVNQGDTLCIIEAMKMMNQIEADKTGTIKKILVENGQPVEYEQPLFVIE